LQWNGTQNATGPDAAVTFAVDVNATGFGDTEAADVGPWALARAHPTFYYDDSTNLTVADRSVEGKRVSYGGGVAAETYGYVFIGDQTTATFQGDGQTIQVVKPAAASTRPGLTAMGHELVRMSERLDVGERDERVTAFVAPDPVREGGRAYGTAFWMGDGEPARDANPTLLHEYVHTRQVLSRSGYVSGQTNSSEWFIEASASLYETLLAWQFNHSSFADFRTNAWDVPSRVVLANQSTYYDAGGNRVSPGYEEGMAVLASLDYRIRAATDGRKSFRDVFREVNRQARNGTVTATALQSIAESVAGRSFETFFDRYVRSRAIPSPPADPSVYPGETVPVTGSVGSSDARSVDDGRVYAFTAGESYPEVIAEPDRRPLEWDFYSSYASAPVESGSWSLPVDPNRTEREPGSYEPTWTFRLVYAQPQTPTTAGDGVPDIYPLAKGVAPDGATDVGRTDLPPAEWFNVTVVDASGTPVDGVEVSLGLNGFASPAQADSITDADGRAFAGRGVPGLDVGGELDVDMAGSDRNVDANFEVVPSGSSLERDATLRYVVGTTGIATGGVVPDDPVRVGESVTVYAITDESAVSGSSADLPVRADGTQLGTITESDDYSSDISVESTAISFQSTGTKSITIDGLAVGDVRVVSASSPGELATSFEAPASAVAETSVPVDVAVTAPDVSGTASGTATVDLSVDGTRTNATSLSLSDGERRTVTLRPRLESAGNRTLTVQTEVTLDGRTYTGNATTVVTVERPPDLQVQSLTTTEPVTVGDTLSVNATVANLGDRTAAQTVALRVGSGTRDAATVTVAPNGTDSVALSWPTTTGDAGAYTATVATANDTATRNVTVEPPARPNFQLGSIATNGPVRAGETLSVSATVTNIGDASGSQSVTFEFGNHTDTVPDVSLAAGGERTLTFDVSTTPDDGGSRTATMRTANDTATRNVTVEPPVRPNFQLGSIATNGPVRAGETLSVSATVTNVGDASGSQTITLSVANGTRSTVTVGLAPGESRSVTVEWATDGTDDGSYTATVATANDSASRVVTVETAPADVAVTSLASNTPVTVGEDLSVAATVENGGGATATRTVTLAVDGTERNRTVVSVAPNGTETVRLDWSTVAGDAGTYTATVTVGNGTVVTAAANESVSVRERSPDPVAEGSTSAPPTDPDGDGRFEDVDGDGDVSYRDVVVLFEQFETVAARPTTAPFDYDGDGAVSFVDLVDLFEHV
jgi:acyl dehydratase